MSPRTPQGVGLQILGSGRLLNESGLDTIEEKCSRLAARDIALHCQLFEALPIGAGVEPENCRQLLVDGLP